MFQTQLLAKQEGFHILIGNTRSQAATMVLKAGESTGGPNNRHEKSDQWLYVLGGIGVAHVDGKEYPLAKDTLLLIEAGAPHEIISKGEEPLRTLNIYAPPAY